jgi:type I restriction enzyme S subunit
VQLREVLKLDLDRVEVDPTETYQMVGVYSFGRGLFDREPVYGGTTSYKQYYRLNAKHIVMSQLFGWEGALGLSSDAFAGKFVSPQFPTFAVDEDRADRDFLGWCMRRKPFWEELGTRTRGMGDRRRTLNPDALFACEIPLPPLAEQRRIVAKIERIAAKMDAAAGLRRQAETEALALLRSGPESIFRQLQSTNGCQTLTDVSESITDGDHITPAFSDHGIRFIFVGNVSTGRLHFENSKRVSNSYFSSLSSRRVPKRGDILYSAVGATLAVPAVVDTDELFCFQRHVAIVKPDRGKVDSRFVWHMLQSSTVFEKAWASTTGSAQPTIPLRAIRKLPIPVPPPSDQRRIVAYLDGMQAKVDRLKALQAQTRAELDALLPSILDRVFKGEL